MSAGLRMGQVTTGTKMVLASKLGSQVSFQPDKNFQQSFASWVKQGQSNNSGKPGKDYRILTLSTAYCTHSEVHIPVCGEQCTFSIFAFSHPGNPPKMIKTFCEVLNLTVRH